MIKNYYKIRFKLLEPLSLGNGENTYSDRDVIKNSQGIPFIPGSSLCGVYRSCIGEKDAQDYFGKLIRPKEGEMDIKESSVLVYDAALDKDDCIISIQDSVGLDDFKTSKEGEKFDFEYVEPGAVFVTYLEQSMVSESEKDIGDLIAKKMCAGEIFLGHKKMRGYGQIELLEVWHKKFELPDQLEAWLDFDMYTEDAETGFSERDILTYEKEEDDASDSVFIELTLKQKPNSGISVRRYTTNLCKDKNNQPDYTQMYYLVDGKEIPYIPGTTWAGAFRHHIKELLPKEKRDVYINRYFGIVDQNKKLQQKSKIRFSESKFDREDAISKTSTRNAIDRFSGGTIDGALYTETTFFNGTTSLSISFPRHVFDDPRDDQLWYRVIAATITDLDEGFLSVGGLTSVGRGMFDVKECRCNGIKIDISTESENEKTPAIYTNLLNVMNHSKSIPTQEE